MSTRRASLVLEGAAAASAGCSPAPAPPAWVVRWRSGPQDGQTLWLPVSGERRRFGGGG